MSFCLSAFSMAARLPQAGTCCGCQPEGLKFLPTAGTTYAQIEETKGGGSCSELQRRLPRLAAPQLSSSPLGFPAQLPCLMTGWGQKGNERLAERPSVKAVLLRLAQAGNPPNASPALGRSGADRARLLCPDSSRCSLFGPRKHR